MIGFVHDGMLWWLVALVPILIAWSFLRGSTDARVARFTVRENWKLLNNQVARRARFHKGVLVLLALVLSVVAAARPFWGTKEREVRRAGVNVIMAIDVSTSMAASDVAPSRLAQARNLARAILTQIPGHRVGVMPFAGEAFLQCPLTSDRGILQDVLGQVNFDSVAMPGSDFEILVDQAVAAFERSGEGTRVLVVLTDGEDHSEALEAAARKAAEKNVRVLALGVGTPEGAPIVAPDGTYKEDRNGIKVLSRLNVEVLRTLADATGGQAWAASAGGSLDPAPVAAFLNSLEKEEFGMDKRVVREERFQWPLGLALLCLVVELLLPDRRRSARVAATAPGAAAALLAVMVLAGSAHAQQGTVPIQKGLPIPDPPPQDTAPATPAPTPVPLNISDRLGFTWWNDGPERIRRGNALYGNGEYDRAESFYQDAQTDLPQGIAAPFNLGLARARQGRHEAAQRAFADAVERAGADPVLRGEALSNLGLSQLEEALALKDEKKREDSIAAALDALRSFNAAVEADPKNERATLNRDEVRRFLNMVAQPPPPQQQSGEGQEGEGEPNEDQQQQPRNQQPQDGEQQQQQQGEQQEPQEGQQNAQQQEQQQQQGKPQEQDENKDQQEQAQSAQAQKDDKPLSEDEARRLLNLIGDEKNVNLRKSRNSMSRAEPEKDW